MQHKRACEFNSLVVNYESGGVNLLERILKYVCIFFLRNVKNKDINNCFLVQGPNRSLFHREK